MPGTKNPDTQAQLLARLPARTEVEHFWDYAEELPLADRLMLMIG
jgi:hypothetical protein